MRALPMYPLLSRNALDGAFPAVKRAQLVYSTLTDIPITTGAGVYQFSTNGLYDPNITGTGIQPLYFDQIMAIWNHYMVESSYIEIQPVFDDAAHSIVMALYIEDDTTTSSSIAGAMMRPGAVSDCINTFGSTTTTLRIGWNLKRAFGNVSQNSGPFRGDASKNPDEQQYFTVFVNDKNLIASNLTVRVRIVFNAVFTEFKTIATS